jgi:hypothetical protein
MKKYLIYGLLAVALLVPAVSVRSQTPVAPQPATTSGTTATISAAAAAFAVQDLALAKAQIKKATDDLLAMKQANQQLLDKQQKTLELLDAMRLTAEQVRIIASRK